MAHLVLKFDFLIDDKISEHIICPFSTYGFSLPLWYLQTVLNQVHCHYITEK